MDSKTSTSSTEGAHSKKRSEAARSKQKVYPTRSQKAQAKEAVAKKLEAEAFLGNFNPETSNREQRKLTSKMNVGRPKGALYDENGIHIESGKDLCDCFSEVCVGCFYPCPKCGSPKCGVKCRVLRKYVYEQIEYQGHDDAIIFNPLVHH